MAQGCRQLAFHLLTRSLSDLVSRIAGILREAEDSGDTFSRLDSASRSCHSNRRGGQQLWGISSVPLWSHFAVPDNDALKDSHMNQTGQHSALILAWYFAFAGPSVASPLTHSLTHFFSDRNVI